MYVSMSGIETACSLMWMHVRDINFVDTVSVVSIVCY